MGGTLSGVVEVEVDPWTDNEGAVWRIVLRFALVDGVVRCTGVNIFAMDDGRRLSWTSMRSAPVPSRIRNLLRDAPRSLYTLAGLGPFNSVGTAGRKGLGLLAPDPDETPKNRRRGRPSLGRAHYEQVALVYRSAPVHPTTSVAEHFGVPVSRAANWVKKARELGLLQPTDVSPSIKDPAGGRGKGSNGRKGST